MVGRQVEVLGSFEMRHAPSVHRPLSTWPSMTVPMLLRHRSGFVVAPPRTKSTWTCSVRSLPESGGHLLVASSVTRIVGSAAGRLGARLPMRSHTRRWPRPGDGLAQARESWRQTPDLLGVASWHAGGTAGAGVASGAALRPASSAGDRAVRSRAGARAGVLPVRARGVRGAAVVDLQLSHADAGLEERALSAAEQRRPAGGFLGAPFPRSGLVDHVIVKKVSSASFELVANPGEDAVTLTAAKKP